MKHKRLLISALLVVAVMAVYWPVNGYDFVNVNDFDYVTKNGHINHGLSWSSVAWAFKITSLVAANWHPVTVLSHMLDCQLYGLNAGGHHLTSLSLHLANTLLLFWLLLRITPSKEMKADPCAEDTNFWPCALVTALFALHPMRVESVAWISERKDVLSVFFFLLTLWAYVRYAQGAKSRAPGWYILALVFFALGLMAKAMLVTLPCVLLLLDYWPMRRIRAFNLSSLLPRIIEKVPFFLLTVAFSIITFLSQKSAGAMGSLEKLPLMARFANAMVSYARYLGKTVWPDSLAVLYPMPEGWAAWKISRAVVLFGVLSLVALWAVRRKPYVFVGWFWFVGMLVPVIGLVQVGQQAMADRFTYLPSIGLFIALVWGLDDFLTWLNRRNLLTVAGVILTAGCIVTTHYQLRYWRDTRTLLLHTVEVTGKNPRANATLGTTLALQGQWTEAEHYLAQAIREKPDFAEAYGDLAGVYARQGKIEEAEKSYETALRMKSSLPMAHFGLANLLMKRGRFDEAFSHLTVAVQINPNFAQAHFLLSILLGRRHDPVAVIAHLRQAVRLEPDWVPALNSLAWNLATQTDAKLRNGNEAVALAMRAVTLTKRNEPGAFDTLAAAYAETGRFAEAAETAENASRMAGASHQMGLAAEIESHLKAYQSQQPWREEP